LELSLFLLKRKTEVTELTEVNSGITPPRGKKQAAIPKKGSVTSVSSVNVLRIGKNVLTLDELDAKIRTYSR